MIDVSLSRIDIETLLAGVVIPYGIIYVLPESIMLPMQDGYKVNLVSLKEYSEEELYALYRIFRLDEEAMRMYDGFEPKCDEQLEFEEAMSDFIEGKRQRMKEDGKLYYTKDEIKDSVNFALLHDIQAKKEGKRMLDDFIAEKEKRKEGKLNEIIKKMTEI